MSRAALYVTCFIITCAGCAGPKSDYPQKPRKTVTLGENTETARLASISKRGGQRWQDIAGRWYRAEYTAHFDYADADVRVTYRKTGPTFAGRLTANGLKPNFAYQIKLVSDRKDKWTFLTLGRLGRWLLTGPRIRGTNFKDAYFKRNQNNRRVKIQSYIVFDYFVTDETGSATTDFAADSSYHVIWSLELNPRKRPGKKHAPIYSHVIRPSGPAYWRPRSEAVQLNMWFEHEWVNRRPAIGKLKLPAGDYKANVQITEESFHIGGLGRWAQVMQKPVSFRIEDSKESAPKGR